jgi:hypothetical protein
MIRMWLVAFATTVLCVMSWTTAGLSLVVPVGYTVTTVAMWGLVVVMTRRAS